MFGDVRDYIAEAPHHPFPGEPERQLVAGGYEARARALAYPDATRVFEFGCQFGFGAMALLEGCPNATWLGWIDNESAFADSNRMARENLELYAQRSGRTFDVWCRTDTRHAIGRVADVVLVDAAHGYADALCDLTLGLAMRPRILAADDWSYPAVREAVAEFARIFALEYEVAHGVGAGLAIFRLEGRRRARATTPRHR